MSTHGTHGSLDLPGPGYCAFCDYLHGKKPFTILEVEPDAAALVTREQRGVGHVLVVPTRHRESILEMTEDDSAGVMRMIVRIARAIDESYHSAGIGVWQNNGTAAGQTIPHVHFHVAGTQSGGGTDRGDVPELSLAETDKIAARIRSALERLS